MTDLLNTFRRYIQVKQIEIEPKSIYFLLVFFCFQLRKNSSWETWNSRPSISADTPRVQQLIFFCRFRRNQIFLFSATSLERLFSGGRCGRFSRRFSRSRSLGRSKSWTWRLFIVRYLNRWSENNLFLFFRVCWPTNRSPMHRSSFSVTKSIFQALWANKNFVTISEFLRWLPARFVNWFLIGFSRLSRCDLSRICFPEFEQTLTLFIDEIWLWRNLELLLFTDKKRNRQKLSGQKIRGHVWLLFRRALHLNHITSIYLSTVNELSTKLISP